MAERKCVEERGRLGGREVLAGGQQKRISQIKEKQPIVGAGEVLLERQKDKQEREVSQTQKEKACKGGLHERPMGWEVSHDEV